MRHRSCEARAAATDHRLHGGGRPWRFRSDGMVRMDGPAPGSRATRCCCDWQGAFQGEYDRLQRESGGTHWREGHLQPPREARRSLGGFAVDWQRHRQRGCAMHRQIPHVIESGACSRVALVQEQAYHRGRQVVAGLLVVPPCVPCLEQRHAALRAPVAADRKRKSEGPGGRQGARSRLRLAPMRSLPRGKYGRHEVWPTAVCERRLLR
mmetsp:Transcript_109845/g.309764  ORF Transcript_109845/g.309764 Transcript_109845/m.309764 type:complete len:209 (-) Transcript_109845:1145-1771(-)